MVKRSSIENLKARVSILEVVGRVTQLKKRGHSYIGLSPFTKEKTPSFYVDPDKGVYYCFSSNQGGDLISFVQATEKLEFYEAIETLAERYNVALEYEEGRAGAPKVDRSLKRELSEIHLYAAEYYAKAIMAEHPEAAAARQYWLEQRQFTLELAKEFGIGYAPATSPTLLERLIAKEFSWEALTQCGLFFAPRNGRNPRELRTRFRGRLMIPLRDAQGNVIAFSGRKMSTHPRR
jgi:DNA primase